MVSFLLALLIAVLLVVEGVEAITLYDEAWSMRFVDTYPEPSDCSPASKAYRVG